MLTPSIQIKKFCHVVCIIKERAIIENDASHFWNAKEIKIKKAMIKMNSDE